ncbi:MAG: pantoate--beta-alanine ligase [Myxococcales bacterium]|nr:pantoate--beta-alanine ligase [Myxococcales bacterium]
MRLVRTYQEMEALADEALRSGKRIGFVPTMGYLHAGHASLMDLARPDCDLLVVSVYVNPLQFGPSEDLTRYPRDPEGDARLCEAHGADVLFMPADLYPDGFATHVSVPELSSTLCGASRPGHFDGVATVCARLFGLTRADFAVMGEKDFQQVAVLRRMTEDLGLRTRIVPAPLIRDTDGVALSSRNTYLSEDERRRAATLHRALFAMRDAAERGTTDVASLLELGRAALDCDRLDYLEIVDAASLRAIDVLGDRPARALGAAIYGRTRLIDNIAIGAS